MKHCLRVISLFGGLMASNVAFSEIFPIIHEVSLDMQYCEKKSQDTNQQIILKMNLLSQISEKQNTQIEGKDLMNQSKLNRSISLSTESYQTIHNILYKNIVFNRTEYICAYKKG